MVAEIHLLPFITGQDFVQELFAVAAVALLPLILVTLFTVKRWAIRAGAD
ncbi:MAG: hypothetical protein PHN84_03330 [Desulfuromonadaceae bacterium]|nr:hypothetical protein [Desulfuromonadaceae bacterium]